MSMKRKPVYFVFRTREVGKTMFTKNIVLNNKRSTWNKSNNNKMGQKETQLEFEIFEEIITLFYDENEKLARLKYNELNKIQKYKFMLYLNDSNVFESQKNQLINILL